MGFFKMFFLFFSYLLITTIETSEPYSFARVYFGPCWNRQVNIFIPEDIQGESDGTCLYLSLQLSMSTSKQFFISLFPPPPPIFGRTFQPEPMPLLQCVTEMAFTIMPIFSPFNFASILSKCGSHKPSPRAQFFFFLSRA